MVKKLEEGKAMKYDNETCERYIRKVGEFRKEVQVLSLTAEKLYNENVALKNRRNILQGGMS